MTVAPYNRAIVFRGVCDSELPLIPSAYRPDGREKLQKIAESYVKVNSTAMDINGELTQEMKERCALLWFYDLANQQGIDLPTIPHLHLGDPLLESSELGKLEGLILLDEWIEIRALAQHYGIPTRMLDWTFDMNTAIYFAIRNLSEADCRDLDKTVSIWMLDKSRLAYVSNEVRFVVPKYHGNPNIEAQSGILSQFLGKYKNNESAFDEIVEEMCKQATGASRLVLQNGNPPILTELKVPYREVPAIQQYFDARGLWHNRFFPGLQGIADAMKEKSGI